PDRSHRRSVSKLMPSARAASLAFKSRASGSRRLAMGVAYVTPWRYLGARVRRWGWRTEDRGAILWSDGFSGITARSGGSRERPGPCPADRHGAVHGGPRVGRRRVLPDRCAGTSAGRPDRADRAGGGLPRGRDAPPVRDPSGAG